MRFYSSELARSGDVEYRRTLYMSQNTRLIADSIADPYCNGTLKSIKYDINDEDCRDQGHRSSVWFWLSSGKKLFEYQYCFLTYDTAKCGSHCPIRMLKLEQFMTQEALDWEKQADEDGWHHLYQDGKKEFGRCVHKLKAKQLDEGKDVWERSYRIVGVSFTGSWQIIQYSVFLIVLCPDL